jgi:hypothetical protein
MINLHYKCRSSEEACNLRDDFCNAVCGWKPYVDNDVVIYDGDEPNTFGIIIGPNNDDDVSFEIDLINKTVKEIKY